MAFRTPIDVRNEFRSHPRRALILTTVVCESRAVRAHLTNPETMVGEKDALYDFGLFSDPAGDWLIVHAITPQGNSDASLVASKAFHEFGNFNIVMFVGVAGSLKDDIPIGSVVIGDYVYNGHSAKVEDTQTFVRPRGMPAARELLTASQSLIYSDEWIGLIRDPHLTKLPDRSSYTCNFPPIATIKGIVSGEEVVAGNGSPRFMLLRSHFNDCGAVEMEGWGVMNAAHHESASAIIVRGISDMCAGKDHAKDVLHQPIAAAHAAAFAFSILSFRGKVPLAESPEFKKTTEPDADADVVTIPIEENRVDFVFNFDGNIEEWTEEKTNAVVERLRQIVNDEKLKLIRIDVGSVRLVMSIRESDIADIDLTKLKGAAVDNGLTLLGATTLDGVSQAEKAKKSLIAASADLLLWDKTLPNGKWIDRPEEDFIVNRFHQISSTTVLLGDPGSGKSALLSKIASHLNDQGKPFFAIKADFIPSEVKSETELQHELQLPALPSDLIFSLALLQPVYIFIDQLDALASQLDLKSSRLNVLLNLVRRLGNVANVHILLSARTFEFNHDVRLRAINAESVTLTLPPWHEVKDRLFEVGVDAEGWPEKARDVVRIPQALKTYIGLVQSGQIEPFSTYQSMLEQLWNDRIASDENAAHLISLSSDIASQMAEEEALWLAAARFDDRLVHLKRLESLGFLVRSDNGLSIAFSHQTIFDYILARTFVRSAGLLSKYVLERQDSLFVRPKVWSALNYLRGAEIVSYEREFLEIWDTSTLRRHLRLLLIEFIGQVSHPLEFEKNCMTEVLTSNELRIFGLKALGSNSGWFSHFASTAIRVAMLGNDLEASQAMRILRLNWKVNNDQVISLLKDNWLPDPTKDRFLWAVLQECPVWNEETEKIAVIVLKRFPVSIWHIEQIAQTIAVEHPDLALRLVKVKLDFLSLDAKRKKIEPPPYPENGTEEEQISWQMRYGRSKELKELLESTEWDNLQTLAEIVPEEFIKNLWPWYVEVFSEIIAERDNEVDNYFYPGRYILEIETNLEEIQSGSREKPLLSAIQIAIEKLAEKLPEKFVEWADSNSHIEILAVQQLIARGYEVAASQLASFSLAWLISDERRFQLGTCYGHRTTTIDLVKACAVIWTAEEAAQFEHSITQYRPQVPDYFNSPEQRRIFADEIRATRKDLLQALGLHRLSQVNSDLVASEQRALGNRFDRSISIGEGGIIGSPMDAQAMGKAKDRDILNILREIPDNTEWDHPTQWMRGGNIQLSRAFAEFAKTDSMRAIRLIEQFEPLHQERAAAYALDAMAEVTSNDNLIIEAFIDLHARGFKAKEFRDSAARALEKIASRKANISDEVIDILVSWLSIESSEEEIIEEIKSDKKSSEESIGQESILWGHGISTILPGGNFTILSALASILLARKELGRDLYLEILESHLKRERNPAIWKSLLYRLGNAGGYNPQVVSIFLRKLFTCFPDILSSREAIIFLAYAQRWDDQLVYDLINGWRNSEEILLQRAYGELVGLISSVKISDKWVLAKSDIIENGTIDMKVGLAYAAVNMWNEKLKLRQSASETLVALLNNEPSKGLVSAVMDVFRVADELTPDSPTILLLRSLANPRIDMSNAPSHFVVDRLQTLLPHESELISKIAEKLVAAWRNELGDISTGTALASPQLTDLALTLHRLGGAARQYGVSLFEAMIEIDAYGARETLAEIDGRFSSYHDQTKPRLHRRRRIRNKKI